MANTADATINVTVTEGGTINTTVVDGGEIAATVTGGGKGDTGPPGTTDHLLLTNIGSNTHAQIDTAISASTSHIANVSNPHSVTKTQVGLGNVDNTSDVNKPVSTATQAALDAKPDSLDELSDVLISSPTDGEVVRYESGQWLNTNVEFSEIGGDPTSNSNLMDVFDTKQPLDSDLTTIAGLTATTDNFIQAKSSAWASRTVAQVKTDLGLTGTNSGDQTSIVGITGTTAQFNTALSDNDFSTLAGTETLTNKTLTNPKIASGDSITDASGNEIVKLYSGASSVNQIVLQNSATTLSPAIYPEGDDANVNLDLYGKGSGAVRVNNARILTESETQTVTNKRITPRVVSMADATSITPTGDTADVNTQTNTQAAGTLTANAPSGTPVDEQKLTLRIKSTNAQTWSWNAIYRGSNDVTLPTSTTGSSKTDRLGFVYNSADAKWSLVAKSLGY